MYSGEYLSMFQRNILYPSSEQQVSMKHYTNASRLYRFAPQKTVIFMVTAGEPQIPFLLFFS
jgi:hypothetical protein